MDGFSLEVSAEHPILVSLSALRCRHTLQQGPILILQMVQLLLMKLAIDRSSHSPNRFAAKLVGTTRAHIQVTR